MTQPTPTNLPQTQQQQMLKAQQNQNLISSFDRVQSANKKHSTVIVANILQIFWGLCLGASLWFLYHDLLSMWWVLAIVGLFLIFSLFGGLVNNELKWRLATAAASCAAIAAPFLAFDGAGSGVWYGIVAAATFFCFLFFAAAELALRAAKKSHLTVRFFTFGDALVSKYTTGLVLASVVFIVSQNAISPVLISQSQFESFISRSAGVFDNVATGGMTLEGFLASKFESLVRRQLSQDSRFQALPTGVQDQLIKRAMTDALKTDGEAGQGTSIVQAFGGKLYSFLVSVTENWRQRLGVFFAILWGFGIFIVIRSIFWIFSYAVIIVAYVLYQFLLAVGVIRLREVAQTQEIIEVI